MLLIFGLFFMATKSVDIYIHDCGSADGWLGGGEFWFSYTSATNCPGSDNACWRLAGCCCIGTEVHPVNPISTSGHNNIFVEFDVFFDRTNAAQGCFVDIYDGWGWNDAFYTITPNSKYKATVALAANADNNQYLKIRFRCDSEVNFDDNCYINDLRIYSNPVTPPPTTAIPTTSAPTTTVPTTSSPTTVAPTTSVPTTSAPTTSVPTTSNPTTLAPTTSAPTRIPTHVPTTNQPTTMQPTTNEPTTSVPTTSTPTTPKPTTSEPSTSAPTTAEPTTNEPTTPEPTTSEPSTFAPTTAEPSNSDPTSAPSTPHPTIDAVVADPIETSTDLNEAGVAGETTATLDDGDSQNNDTRKRTTYTTYILLAAIILVVLCCFVMLGCMLKICVYYFKANMKANEEQMNVQVDKIELCATSPRSTGSNSNVDGEKAKFEFGTKLTSQSNIEMEQMDGNDGTNSTGDISQESENESDDNMYGDDARSFGEGNHVTVGGGTAADMGLGNVFISTPQSDDSGDEMYSNTLRSVTKGK